MKRFKSIKMILTVLVASSIPMLSAEQLRNEICIMKIVDHEALNKTVLGICNELAKRNIDIRVESAQGNSLLAVQIAQRYSYRRPQIVVGVGTVAAQTILPNISSTGSVLVFSSITDPAAAGLSERKNVTGVSNFVPLEPQLKLFRRIQPNLSSLGIIYNPGEINSLSIVKKLHSACLQMGITLIEQAATKTSEVSQAANRLADKVDAIFVSNDNTALAALGAIIAAGKKFGIPVYVSDTDAVAMGALAALGPNQYQVGLQTGVLISHILDGVDPKDLPIENVNNMELFLNIKVANEMGIVFAPELLEEAKEIIR